MKGQRSVFVCSSCGFQSPRWYGKCPECGEWNTMVQVEAEAVEGSRQGEGAMAVPFAALPESLVSRFSSGFEEFDRVLGGGFVPGSLVLLGGEPGVGKSTLLLKSADMVSGSGRKVLYTSGEESQSQVAMRSRRLGVKNPNLFFLGSQNVDSIIEAARKVEPCLVIVDSIQTAEDPSLPSLPGTPVQIRACAAKLLGFAKENDVTVVLVGHTVKTGEIAGPRLLEHLVDTVLYFEGEKANLHRIIRAQKNRFGPTYEVCVFRMEEEGLEEVKNPSQEFLSERSPENPGSCVSVCLTGTQPICVEVEALVVPSVYGAPRRICTELDQNRVSLVLAVLSRNVAAGLEARDAFLKIPGGFRVSEPAVDLACAVALVSSYRQVPVADDLVVIGELGLSGEVRMVPRLEDRVKEALRMGFSRALVPERFVRGLSQKNLIGVRTVEEAVRYALRNHG